MSTTNKEIEEDLIRYLKNGKTPQLDLILSGGVKNKGETLEKSLKGNIKKDYYVGMTYSRSIGNTQAENALKKAKFQQKLSVYDIYKCSAQKKRGAISCQNVEILACDHRQKGHEHLLPKKRSFLMRAV